MNPLDAVRPYLAYAKAAAMLLTLLLACSMTYKCTADHYRLKIERKDRVQAQAIAKRSEAYRKQEQELSEFAGLLALNMQEFKDEKLAQRDRVIADLRSGRLSFRPGCGVPEAAANPGPAPESLDSGQPRLVAEAITDRFAACDEVTHERNQAVELLRAERR